MIVVADASPVIAVDQVGQLSLLEGLFGTVLAPPPMTPFPKQLGHQT